MVLHRIMSRRRFLAGSVVASAMVFTPTLPGLSPAGATASEFFAVATPGLRLRSGPGLGYKILASLSMGARVERLAPGVKADGYVWVKVRVVSSGKIGFVAFKFLTTAPSDGFEIGQTVHVEAGGGRGNLRSGPGTDYRVIATLSTGATGTIKDGPVEATGHFWHKVSFGNMTGWIVTSVLFPGAGKEDRSDGREPSAPVDGRPRWIDCPCRADLTGWRGHVADALGSRRLHAGGWHRASWPGPEQGRQPTSRPVPGM